jgi:hypothetical protein
MIWISPPKKKLVGNAKISVLFSVVWRCLGHFEPNKNASKSTFLDSRIKKIAFGSEDKRRKSRLRVNLSNIYTYHYWGLKKTFPFLFI